MKKGICAIEGCEHSSHKEYWIEFSIEEFEGMVQVNICADCFQKIRNGQPYSIK